MVDGGFGETNQPQPRLEVDQVTLQYRTRDYAVRATQRVSFDVHAADRFVLLGPSGCGKSSLLKAIAGFIEPVEGEIRLDGRKVTEPGADRMMVFQEFDQLLPWKTVEQNVLFPMERTGKYAKTEAKERAKRFLDKVKLSKFAHVYPHQLSGGMKQRVAIARALALEPRVLLMDEPFAALDALTRREMQQELLQLWDEARFTLVFVTHSIHEAIVVGNRILVLSPHPGRVKAELNSGDFGEGPGADAAIQALDRRINDMLFGEGAELHGAH